MELMDPDGPHNCSVGDARSELFEIDLDMQAQNPLLPDGWCGTR